MNYIIEGDSIIVKKSILLEYFSTIENLIDFTQSFQEGQNHYVKDLLF